MKSAVVDTNVLVVANGRSDHAGESCVLASAGALADLRRNGRVVLDEGALILTEYRKHLSHSGQPGVGDAFFKWIFDNQANSRHCLRVNLHEDPDRGFQEFPDDPDLEAFDRDDRKFVAAARAVDSAPAILNAVDSDWWNFRAQLERHGLRIEFLCPEQFERDRNRRRGAT